MFLLAAAMYVDNTDLLHLGNDRHMDDEELIEQVQQSTTDFGMLAQAGGGAFKPEKCSVYLMCYEKITGKKRLKSLKKHPDPSSYVNVKQADGSFAMEPSHIKIP